jgi:hypothetical protein
MRTNFKSKGLRITREVNQTRINHLMAVDRKTLADSLHLMVAVPQDRILATTTGTMATINIMAIINTEMVETLIITKIMEAIEITGIERVEEAIIMGEVATSTTITTEVEDITITTLARTTTINTRKMGSVKSSRKVPRTQCPRQTKIKSGNMTSTTRLCRKQTVLFKSLQIPAPVNLNTAMKETLVSRQGARLREIITSGRDNRDITRGLSKVIIVVTIKDSMIEVGVAEAEEKRTPTTITSKCMTIFSISQQ